MVGAAIWVAVFADITKSTMPINARRRALIEVPNMTISRPVAMTDHNVGYGRPMHYCVAHIALVYANRLTFCPDKFTDKA